MKAVEQYFHVVLFIMLYKMVFTSNSVDKTLVCQGDYNKVIKTFKSSEKPRVTIKMKAIEQYFYVVLFMMMTRTRWFYLSSLWMNPSCVTTEMRATDQFFHVVLFMLYKVILTFKSVDETLVCDHSYESYWPVLSCGTIYASWGGSNF